MSELAITEELLGRSHPMVEMPPLWSVIYYEGIQGNHILFAPHEVLAFETTGDQLGEAPGEKAWLEEVGYHLSGLCSYRDLVDAISALTLDQRRQVYRLYKTWLQGMGAFLRLQAH